MAISDIIDDIAPEFNNEDPARIDRFIGYAELQVSPDAFGTKHDLAVAYLTSHMLSLANRNDDEGTNGTPGTITQKKEGDLSLSFGTPSDIAHGTDGTLLLTSYGIEYLRLRDMCVISPGVYSAE
jgi:hypothetical protein